MGVLDLAAYGEIIDGGKFSRAESRFGNWGFGFWVRGLGENER